MQYREYFTVSASKKTGLITHDRLAALYTESSYQFDLYEGTAVDSSNTRIIYLSTDIIRGIQAALSFEAGAAWTLVLKRSGTLWGKRIFKALNKQVLAEFGEKMPMMSVPNLFALLSEYFGLHGWGRLRFDTSIANTSGVLVVELHNGMISDSLDSLKERADYIVAGMLGAFFSELSGVELDCIEVTTPLLGAESSRFYITDTDRIASLSTLIEEGMSEDEIRQRLA